MRRGEELALLEAERCEARLLLTFPQQQALRGHRGPDHQAVGLVQRVGQVLQLLGPIHPRPQ